MKIDKGAAPRRKDKKTNTEKKKEMYLYLYLFCVFTQNKYKYKYKLREKSKYEEKYAQNGECLAPQSIIRPRNKKNSL